MSQKRYLNIKLPKCMKLQKLFDFQKFVETLVIFRRSLIYQTKEFFQNSTLHGVRYIAETGRPIGEKFMWFCFTSIGAVTALVIIMSLWEKFQTNPTITGLDTDFHNQNIVFPTTIVCPDAPFDADKAFHVSLSSLANYDVATAAMTAPFLEALTSLSFENIKDAYMLGQSIPVESWNDDTLRQWAFKAHIGCENTLLECKYRDEVIQCCSHFDVVYTEHGFCFAFNSRFKSTETADQKQSSPHDLYETDKKWALFFLPNATSKIFIFSYEEYFGKDFSAQIEWEPEKKVEVRISKKNTYTTDDARQLTIGQRKCIFHDEVKLKYFPDDYTFSSCMKECRIKKAIKLCKCNPPFYKPIPNVPMCKVDQLVCLDEFKANITNIKECLHCELSCSKTVFTIEKLSKGTDASEPGVSVEFLTWPIIRYKREVLFGWVDLLVSFGGIASLFLGFSLLSGVEIIYYFTLRACCMVYKNRQELYEMEEEIKRKPPPLINLSMRMKYQQGKTVHVAKSTIDSTTTNNLNNSKMLNTRNNLPLNVLPTPTTTNGDGGGATTMELGRRRRIEKDYNTYSKMMYKPIKDGNHLPYGRYLP